MLKSAKITVIIIVFIYLLQAAAGLNLQDVKETDFLFYRMKDPLLYADIFFDVNPAVLSRLTSPLLINAFDFTWNSDSNDYIRLDNTVGEIGGTRTANTTLIKPDLSFTAFFPPKKEKNKKKDNSVWGFSCDLDMEYSNNSNKYVNYNSYTESLDVIQETLPAGFFLDYFLAVPLTGPDFGFSAGYGLNFTPKSFTMVTDNSLLPSVTYATDTLKATDEYLHKARARIGTIMNISPTAELKLAAGYKGGFRDNSAEYIAIDTDGDGRKETIMLYKDYVTYTGTGGPADQAMSFSLNDFTLSTTVTLHPALRLYLARGTDIFLNGNYSLFDLQTSTYWKRLRTTADIDDDLSQKTTIYDASFGTFDVLAGISLEDSKKKSIAKMGIGYSRRGMHFSQDGQNRAGLSLYSRYNVNHYDELSLGAEPANNALVANNVIPGDTVYQALIGRAGLEWTPAEKIIFFASLSVTGKHETKTYYAYNLDTRTVWSETQTSMALDWDINALAGLSFLLSKTLRCTIDYRGVSTDGLFGLDQETALFDEEFLRTSTNGTVDRESENQLNFSLGITFLLLL